MHKIVLLSTGDAVKVDELDYDFLMQWKWTARTSAKGILYACRTTRAGGMPPVTIYMHRQILGIGDGKYIVDHINHDTLDNRKGNLRLCSAAQNAINAYSDGRRQKSPFRGVTQTSSHRSVAQARVNGAKMRFGIRDSAEEAARLYDQEIRKHHGEFAILNFPGDATS